MTDAKIVIPTCKDYADRIVMHAQCLAHLGDQLEDGEHMNISETRNDKRHGIDMTFRKINGQIIKEREDNYEYGELHGKSMTYGENGLPLLQSHYFYDRLNGPSIFYKENGAIDTITYFELNTEMPKDSKALNATLRDLQWADNLIDMGRKMVGLSVPTPVERAERQFEWLKKKCFKPDY